MSTSWNKAAEVRRAQIESGLDITFNRVFVPYFLKCVEAISPKRILEVGCGTGHLAVKLAAICPHVEALEPSSGMRSVASSVLAKSNVTLHSSVIEKFRSKQRFDLVISHLCGHVIADIDDFCRACSRSLKPRGVFVFSLPHPCFWNDYKEFFPRQTFRYSEEQFASVVLTITKDPSRPIEGLPFHHRPLGRYITALRKAGLGLSHLDEIIPPKTIQRLYGGEWRFPRYCVLHATRIV